MNFNNITIYATCQGEGIKYYLKYYIPQSNINVIHNYTHIYTNNDINYNILKNTDLFIYQHLDKKWGKFSTDLSVKNNVLSYLPNTIPKITIPYIYCDWIWALGKTRLKNLTPDFNDLSKKTSEKIIYINQNIITNLKKNYDLETILKLYDDNKIDFNYKKRMEDQIKILKKKEENCDIKISEYILSNYKEKKLFLCQNHPTTYIFKNITKQILNKLNIQFNNFDENFINNNNFYLGNEYVFSKYDIDYHNLKFQVNINDNFIKNLIKEIYYL